MNEWMLVFELCPCWELSFSLLFGFTFTGETISLPSQPSLVSLVKKEKIKKSWKKNETYFVFLIVV